MSEPQTGIRARYTLGRMQAIDLGKQGENLARTVEIDVSNLLAAYPGATITLLVERPEDDTPYVATTTVEDGVLVWPITDADTAFAGSGRIEIRAVLGDVLAKSAMGATRVASSLTGSGAEPPEPVKDWLDRVLKAGESARTGAEQATASAQVARTGAEQATASAQEARDSAERATGAANQAEAAAERSEAAANEIDAAKRDVIDKVCPPFETSGSAVQCYPVEGYPLDVKTRIEAVQEGEGDPSPDNVRPIVGWDNLTVTRCGANVVDFELAQVGYANSYHIAQERTGPNTFHFYSVGAFPRADNLSFVFANLPDFSLSGKGVAFSFEVKKISGIKRVRTVYGLRKNERALAISLDTTDDGSGSDLDLILDLTARFPGGAVEYAPYAGDAFAQALPETVYGGSYNWATGELVVDTQSFVVGNENKFTFAASYWNLNMRNAKSIKDVSHFPKDKFHLNSNNHFIFTGPFGLGEYFGSCDELNAYCQRQYEQGTPVEILYEVTDPKTYHLTPRQILAIPGLNTVFSNAGGTTVSGRADPIRINQSMLDRIAALEAAQTGL